MDLWEKQPDSLKRAYESRLVTEWGTAREKVAAMEAADAINKGRKRSEDKALAEKYNMAEARDL